MRKSKSKKKLTNKELKQLVITEATGMVESLPDPKEYPQHEFSPAHEEYMQKLIEKTRKKEKARKWWAKFLRRQK